MGTPKPMRRSARVRTYRRMAIGGLGRAMVIVACAWTGNAMAQSADVYQLSRQVSDMQRDLAQLQQQMYGSPAPSSGRGGPIDLNPAYRERVEVRLSEMESQLRDLTGRVEETSFAVRRMEDRLEKLVQDVDFRLAALERGGGASAATAPTEIPPAASSGAAAGDASPAGGTEAEPARTANLLPAGSAAEQYQEAQRLLMQGRYDEAEGELRRFVDQHPDSQLSDNARYWLGESYYVRKRYEEAASTFLDAYKRAPAGSKAPDNLLKLGLSLEALDKEQEACVAINKLLREHPDSPDHIRRRAEQEKKALSCT